MRFAAVALCQYTSLIKELFIIFSLAPRPSEEEGEGRPGTHCMRTRHHSPDFGESDYVWILSVYFYGRFYGKIYGKCSTCACSEYQAFIPLPLPLRRPGDEAT